MNTTFFADTHDLLAEQYDGRFPGLLNMASDFLLRFRATEGFASDEAVAEAAFAEGFAEEEIAAALLIESGEYQIPGDPRGVGFGWK